jgi:L-methionine (R)-S-oxide reductase
MTVKLPEPAGGSPEALYAQLLAALDALVAGERNRVANLANTAALLYATLPDLNWAGFYLYDGAGLVVGPFQGRPACVRIALGAGVCGSAAAARQTLLVPDVHAFPGHIACDAASNSEIVVPLLDGERLLGVMDLDSPRPARFGSPDARGLEALAARLVRASDW